MTESPPTKPGADSADDAARSVQAQLDRLLAQIETEEPGTVDAEALPAGFKSPKAGDAGATAGAPSPTEPATDDDLAEAMASFEQALDAGASEDAAASKPGSMPAEQAAEAQMLAALNSELQGVDAGTMNDAGSGEASDPEQPLAHAENETETDMLAALNAALEDLHPGASTDAGSQASADAPEAPSEAEGSKPFDESSLQDEISALLNAPPEAEADASPTDGLDPAQTAEAAVSTEDQIAAEIESLLDADAHAPVGPDATEDDRLETAPPAPDASNPSIDELDQLLAEEIDDDDELAGDFQSVQDITAGIDTGQDPAPAMDDDHAATARDVADELDSQPEARASEPAPTDEIDLDAIAANQRGPAERVPDPATSPRDWPGTLARAKAVALGLCFLLNWPARRFLTHEWRANLGYVALLNLFFGVALWIYLILR
ncbi:MAG: hypothetical protein ACE37H_10770 [Phycisphaeraceae bacterium]